MTRDFNGLLRQACLIDGDWVGEPCLAIRNPATGQEIGRVPDFGAAQTHRAIAAAQAAFGPWSARIAKDRSNVLKRFAELIVARADDLAALLTAEQGKPLAEARGEVVAAAGYIEFFAEEARRVNGEIIPAHRADSRILVMQQPIGVVAAITPWNFPAGMIARKIGPALAAGCTVVLKPAPETPFTALALGELAQQAGLPPGALNIVTGDAKAIGEAIFADPAVRFVGFTGSTETGKALMRRAADGVKKIGLELGGHAPFIVLDDADLGAAVEGAMIAKFRNMGQTCVCANRIWVHARVHDEFLTRFADKVGALVLGPGDRSDVTQGPLINDKALAKVGEHVGDALARQARLIAGGKPSALGGTYFEPTILAGVTDEMRIAREETFGPVAAISAFDDDADVIRRANTTEYGLAAYVYGRDLARLVRFGERLEYGMVGINSVALGTEVAPIGGMKQSGIGREGSHHGILEYCETKYLLLGGV